MSCFTCFNPLKRDSRRRIDNSGASGSRLPASSPAGLDATGAHVFTFQEMANATQNFMEENMIGLGGFGKVFKGRLPTGMVVAIKQLRQDEDNKQGNKEFLMEALMLSMLRDEHLVRLIGYCAQGDERILVYEYMPQGSLEDHLFDLKPNKQPLDWDTRIKIAVGAAKGLTYLHDVANPPVIFRDLKASNILLSNDFNSKLSDFGLAKFGPVGDRSHVTTRVMGTDGYCAPDYLFSGRLTVKSDVYSFGVVLLELISGRRAIEITNTGEHEILVHWARPILSKRRRWHELADPQLQGRYPHEAFDHLVLIIQYCVQDRDNLRPVISDVLQALKHVASQPYQRDSLQNIPSCSDRHPL